jgi:MFS family permease
MADRVGRGRVLIGSYLAVAAGLAVLPFTHGGPGTVIALLLVGTASGSFYPLGLALLGQRLKPAQVAPANAWYLGINCAASLASQPLSGLAMDRLGPWGLFVVGELAVLAVLTVCVLGRRVGARGQESGVKGQKDQLDAAA